MRFPRMAGDMDGQGNSMVSRPSQSRCAMVNRDQIRGVEGLFGRHISMPREELAQWLLMRK
jgi:hypothetical protein